MALSPQVGPGEEDPPVVAVLFSAKIWLSFDMVAGPAYPVA